MILFTDQGHDLSKFAGRILLCHSQYMDSPDIMAALKRLYDVMRNDQVIWCSHSPLPHGYTENTRFQHTIDADERDVQMRINTFVWETCILQRRIIPTKVRLDLMSACHAAESEVRQSELDMKIDAYIAARMPDDPWIHLFSPVEDLEMSSVLLRWPFRHSLIVRTDPYPQ